MENASCVNNVNKYSDEDLLMLSGIQHFAFCQRQWALIHIEQRWDENVRTVEGQFIHERTDNPFENESRGECRTVRAMPLVSYELGLRGIADVVEFWRQEKQDAGITVKLDRREGFWRICPIEYKAGKPKKDDRDVVQLCAQAICLEEMMDVRIDEGALYYAQTRHREKISFDQAIRSRVKELSQRMHEMFGNGITPVAVPGKNCRLCSLVEICQPRLTKKYRSVSNYLKSYLTEMTVEGELK